MRYLDCTYPEIAAYAADGWLALVPMGRTEQQGPHLAVGFDTWFAEELLTAASQQAAATHEIGSLVASAAVRAHCRTPRLSQRLR